MKLRAAHTRYIVVTLAIISAFPLPVAWLNGIFIWMSPLYSASRALGFQSLQWLNLIGLAALVIVFFRKRWICRYACPTGIACDLGSSLGKRKSVIKGKPNRIFAISILVMSVIGFPIFLVFDPFNIFYSSFEVLRSGIGIAALIKAAGIPGLFLFSWAFPNIWCASLCPLGGLQDMVHDTRKLRKQPGRSGHLKGIGRRTFIGALAGTGIALVIPRLLREKTRKPVRPPFSLDEEKFNLVCTRCGNCTASCPTGIITPIYHACGFEEFLTPKISFEQSYCLPECNRCGTVCPSGAIKPFRVDDKKNYRMAGVEIDLENCLLMQNRECIQCKNYCAYDAIKFSFNEVYQVSLPEVDPEKCTGCAACKIVCPVQVITITA